MSYSLALRGESKDRGIDLLPISLHETFSVSVLLFPEENDLEMNLGVQLGRFMRKAG